MVFTKQVYQEFKMAYVKALNDNKDQFSFQGHDFLTSYAKYLLMYLKPKFEK
jgi:hypothetical protein